MTETGGIEAVFFIALSEREPNSISIIITRKPFYFARSEAEEVVGKMVSDGHFETGELEVIKLWRAVTN